MRHGLMWGLLALVMCLGGVACSDNPQATGESAGKITPRKGRGFDLGSAVGQSLATGSTSGRPNESTPTCHGDAVRHSAPEVSFTWKAPFTDYFTFDTEGSGFDTVLSVRTAQGNVVVGCNNNAAPDNPMSSLTVSITGGTVYTLTVDGYGASSGNYQLNIDSLSCPGGCEAPQNGCYSATASCDTSAHRCRFTTLEAGTKCDDGNPCTSSDVCDKAGNCNGIPAVCNTPPPNSCYEESGTCDPATGDCSYALKAVGEACDDGNGCTIHDVCDAVGSCDGAAVECKSPPDQCFEASGTCDVTTGQCLYAAKGTDKACDDGNACTLGDRCDGVGHCGGAPVACTSPPNKCYQPGGTCNPVTGQCQYNAELVGTPCTDGKACTFNDACDGVGNCGGAAVACESPPGQCFEASGTCNPATGQCNYVPKGKDQACNDGNACTHSDRCNGAGNCGGTVVACSNPPICHTYGACDPATGECHYALQVAGTPCTDGTACTVNDMCDGAGNCQGTAVACTSPPSQCFEASGFCNQDTGQCSYAPKGAEQGCDDGNACTVNDRCNRVGGCSGTPKVCALPPKCYKAAGTCNPAIGQCQYEPESSGTPCNDDNACTVNDVCDGAGSCRGTTTACNSPPTQCFEASGVCNPATGQCHYLPKGTDKKCDDGSACTLGDRCDGKGSCGGTPVVCNSPLQCSKPGGTCNPTTGQCRYEPQPVSTRCDDGRQCTVNDMCDGAGSCRGTAKVCQGESQCLEVKGTCNENTGACSFTPKPSTTSCNDRNPCTENDTCDGAGNCRGSPVLCDGTPNDCYQGLGTCNPGTGQCHYDFKPEGSSCGGDRGTCSIDRCDGRGHCISRDNCPPRKCSGEGTCTPRGCVYECIDRPGCPPCFER